MFFKRIFTESIAHYSYILGDKDELIVIDPQREVDKYIDIARENGMKIKKIFETHRNEDFLVGSTSLSHLSGAKIYISGHEDLDYQYGDKIYDGDEFKIGDLKLKSLHTPGHTKGHMSYALYFKDKPYMVFTGDTIFYGDVGRVDFYGEENLDKMAALLYDSIFNKIFPLGDHVLLHPAHGAGSACGENTEERPFTTIGYERRFNPKLKVKDEDEFIELNANQLFKPPYFEYMEKMNLKKNLSLDCNFKFNIKYPKDLKEDEYIVDIRSQDAFNKNHIKDSIFLPKGEIPGFINWVVDRESNICFITEHLDKESLNKLYRDLRRIGYTGSLNFLAKGIFSWHKEGGKTSSIETIKPKEFREIREDIFILDVRKKSEIKDKDSSIDLIIPIEEIDSRWEELPKDKDILVICPSGIRSNIVASFLKAKGIETKVLIGGLDSLK